MSRLMTLSHLMHMECRNMSSLFVFVFGTGDDGVTKELGGEEVRETAVERRQRRMKEKLEKAKLRKKALFDSEYDAVGVSADGKSFFDDWKSEMELQAKVSVCQYFSSLCCFLCPTSITEQPKLTAII